jgi:hypothetical protein
MVGYYRPDFADALAPMINTLRHLGLYKTVMAGGLFVASEASCFTVAAFWIVVVLWLWYVPRRGTGYGVCSLDQSALIDVDTKQFVSEAARAGALTATFCFAALTSTLTAFTRGSWVRSPREAPLPKFKTGLTGSFAVTPEAFVVTRYAR